jgi:hypothetical protein
MAESELASDARSREIGLVLIQRHTSNVSGQRGHRRERTSSNPVNDYYQSQIPSEHQVLHSPSLLLGFIGDKLATQRELASVPCFRDAPSRDDIAAQLSETLATGWTRNITTHKLEKTAISENCRSWSGTHTYIIRSRLRRFKVRIVPSLLLSVALFQRAFQRVALA